MLFKFSKRALTGALAPVALLLSGCTWFDDYWRDAPLPLDTVYYSLATIDMSGLLAARPPAEKNKPHPRILRVFGPENSITWRIMSGNEIAIDMVATLEPVDEGRTTRIHANVTSYKLSNESSTDSSAEAIAAMKAMFTKAFETRMALIENYYSQNVRVVSTDKSDAMAAERAADLKRLQMVINPMGAQQAQIEKIFKQVDEQMTRASRQMDDSRYSAGMPTVDVSRP